MTIDQFATSYPQQDEPCSIDDAVATPANDLQTPRLKAHFGPGSAKDFNFFLPDIDATASFNPRYMTSAHCVAADFYSTQFVDFCARVGSRPRLHRKLWEFAFVHENLNRFGALRPGARGIGFGVGGECLPALFVAHGCEILATDAPEEISRDWIDTDQWSHGTSGLLWPTIAPDDLVREKVEFMACDMNAVPDFEHKFDFSWSACCFEHLGSIELGMRFIIENVEKCLVPGGVACHTSELNLSSNEHTVGDGPTVLFRRRDIEELADRLTARGHDVSLGRFEPGDSFIDGLVDLPPFCEDLHLRLKICEYVTTSFGLTVRKAR